MNAGSLIPAFLRGPSELSRTARGVARITVFLQIGESEVIRPQELEMLVWGQEGETKASLLVGGKTHLQIPETDGLCLLGRQAQGPQRYWAQEI